MDVSDVASVAFGSGDLGTVEEPGSTALIPEPVTARAMHRKHSLCFSACISLIESRSAGRVHLIAALSIKRRHRTLRMTALLAAVGMMGEDEVGGVAAPCRFFRVISQPESRSFAVWMT